MARHSRRHFIAAIGLFAAGCLSPTLPLPPPSQPDVEGPDEQGQVTLDGYAQPNAVVLCENQQTGELRGVHLSNDSHYRFQIGAKVGDTMKLWYELGSDASPAILFKVPN